MRRYIVTRCEKISDLEYLEGKVSSYIQDFAVYVFLVQADLVSHTYLSINLQSCVLRTFYSTVCAVFALFGVC